MAQNTKCSDVCSGTMRITCTVPKSICVWLVQYQCMLYVCVCVCAFACVCMCMCACVYSDMCVHVHACVCTEYMYVRVCVHVCVLCIQFLIYCCLAIHLHMLVHCRHSLVNETCFNLLIVLGTLFMGAHDLFCILIPHEYVIHGGT